MCLVSAITYMHMYMYMHMHMYMHIYVHACIIIYFVRYIYIYIRVYLIPHANNNIIKSFNYLLYSLVHFSRHCTCACHMDLSMYGLQYSDACLYGILWCDLEKKE